MDVTQPTASAPPAINTGVSARPAISSDFETFLKMLTVQMQNQDPLNPVDSGDYAVQLATFSGVEQQVQTNDLLRDLSEMMNFSGMAQMASWVGQEARAATAGYFDGAPISLAPNPISQADRVEIVVTDANGLEVGRFDTPVSADVIEWDGLDGQGVSLPHGLYSFEEISYIGDDAMTNDPVAVYSQITEVRSQGGETILILEGGAAVSASQVNALRAPTVGSSLP